GVGPTKTLIVSAVTRVPPCLLSASRTVLFQSSVAALSRGRSRPHLEGTCGPGRGAVDVDNDLRLPRRPQANTRPRTDSRGRHERVRKELAARIMLKQTKIDSL